MSPVPAPAAFDLSIVIPAYNEAGRLPRTLARIAAWALDSRRKVEIIVVDDGSADGTATVAAGAAALAPGLAWQILRNSPNRGKGYSVRRGMLAARGERLLFSDADLSAPIEEIALLDAALDTGADIAIGSRSRRELLGTRQSVFRESAGRFFNLIVRASLGLPFTDTQCGFKLFRRAAARAIFSRQRIEGWGFDPELLFLARRQHLTVVEIPVRWSHAEGAKIRMFRDSARMFADVVRIRANAGRGRYDNGAALTLDPLPETAAEPRIRI